MTTPTPERDSHFELYKLYLETAEKTTDRRGSANNWMLSVNAAITGFYGYLSKDGVPEAQGDVWYWAIPAAGVLISIAWFVLIGNYRTLNRAKFQILQEIEEDFEIRLFHKEYELYKANMPYNFSAVEQAIPIAFIAFYVGLAIAAHAAIS